MDQVYGKRLGLVVFENRPDVASGGRLGRLIMEHPHSADAGDGGVNGRLRRRDGKPHMDRHVLDLFWIRPIEPPRRRRREEVKANVR